MYISYVAKARLFTAVLSQLSIFTADCLRHPIRMAGVETIWELHTLSVIYSWLHIILHVYVQLCNHGNHIVTVDHDCVGVVDEWRPRIKQRPASEFIKSSEQESRSNIKYTVSGITSKLLIHCKKVLVTSTIFWLPQLHSFHV